MSMTRKSAATTLITLVHYQLTTGYSKLAEFYSEACTLSRPVYAVFQVTGEVATSRASPSNGLEGDENAMAVDSEVEHTEDTEKFVSLKTVLVGESALERTCLPFCTVS